MDVYQRHLTNTIIEMEERYGLHTLLSRDMKIVHLGIEDFLQKVNEMVNNISEESKKTMNIKVGQKIAMLSYIDYSLQFSEFVRLDYKMYPSLDKLCECLLRFTKRELINDNVRSSANMIAELLLQMERLSEKFISSLGYRFLRIFLVMLIFGSERDASIVARFILNQILISRRLNNGSGDKRTNSAGRTG